MIKQVTSVALWRAMVTYPRAIVTIEMANARWVKDRGRVLVLETVLHVTRPVREVPGGSIRAAVTRSELVQWWQQRPPEEATMLVSWEDPQGRLRLAELSMQASREEILLNVGKEVSL